MAKMGFVGQALWLIKQRQFDSAAKMLEAHLNDKDLKHSSKSSIMSWIGECYFKSEDRSRAGKWYEMAGRTALESSELSDKERSERALREFEQAMDCYRFVDDIEGLGRLAYLRETVLASKKA